LVNLAQGRCAGLVVVDDREDLRESSTIRVLRAIWKVRHALRLLRRHAGAPGAQQGRAPYVYATARYVDPEAIPDLNEWEAYCEECGAFREVLRAQERNTASGAEYFECVCTACHSILLTFQRLGTQRGESKPARPTSFSRCPHCGELNVFPGLDPIIAYACRHCGQGVDASPPVQ
jgi:hypothetical protein